MKNFKKNISLLLIALMCVTGLSACGNSEDGNSSSITMAGSTSMEKLAKSFGEAYSEANSGVNISVQGGGSSAGITSVKDGAADIGMLSRELKDEEKSDSFKETQIAIDGIALVVNKENSVKNLTLKQVSDIFTGKITNWKEVGGSDSEIVVIGREAGSGTRDGFESVVGIEEKAKYKSELSETGQVKSTVSSTPGAIGYISLGYADDTINTLKVNGVEPTAINVQNKTYAIQRPFILVTKAETSEEITNFIEYMLGDEGKVIITNAHFIPVN